MTQYMSPQQAAEHLGVSRPFVLKLCREGVLPFVWVGTNRRILRTEVEAYDRRRVGQPVGQGVKQAEGG